MTVRPGGTPSRTPRVSIDTLLSPPVERLLRSGPFVAVARAANALFFLLTATYCILTYSSFAYQQFIRPRMVASLSSFVAFHHLWHWLLLVLTVATLLPDWKHGRGRTLAATYVAAMALVGVAILYRPVLPSVENDALGLWLAGLFLVPPIWLAAYDHLAASTPAPRPVDASRLAMSGAGSALVVWAVHVSSAPLRFGDLGDYTTSTAALIFGAAVSLAVHVGIFTIVGVLLAALLTGVARLGASGRTQYGLIATTAFGFSVVTLKALVFASLSFTGAAAWVISVACALACVATWSAVSMRLAAARGGHVTAMELWLGPVPGSQSVRGAAIGLVVVAVAGFVLTQRVETFDWNFLVQNLCVLIGWLLTAAMVHAVVRRRAAASGTQPFAVAALAIVAVAGVGAGGSIETTLPGSRQFVPEFVLDAYATVDPSYHLLRQLLAVEAPGARDFYAGLAANSLIEHVEVQPIDVDVVQPLTKAPVRPPDIFLFVIDSLRRDYVSAYNPAVTFTPAFAQFAREDFAFERAFTRYGGTGLSMPAIWAGSMILHKEYVLPFTRMNALEKLLRVNDYRVAMSMDHITSQIVEPASVQVPLDAGRPEMQYDFCTTLDELQTKLAGELDRSRPVFAHTRSLNLHISKLTERVGAPDPAFGGFQAPAAAAVRRMDGCFGRFITFLKDTGRYDNSIVILTSDHGDALGEARRWGHSYTLFPEIVRTPLLVHIPSRLRAQFTEDLGATAFSTDITPTLYALLGYPVEPHAWPQGQSLFVPPGTDLSWRRREPAIVASSYGPVYGILRDNGRLLYIADGVNSRDYAYDLSGLKPVRIGVTPQMRDTDRPLIRESLATLASLYHYTPSK